jgi:hypothetical protein
MPNITSQQLYACAKAAKKLMQQGNHGPKAEEIAEEAHGGLWPIGPEDINWIITHAKQIKDILVNQEEMSVILVNKEYYKIFRRRLPATPELAKKVLPGRGISKPAGFHLVTTEDDPIWLASQNRLGDVGLGVVTKYKHEIQRAINEGRLTNVNGAKYVREIKNKI